MSSVLWLFCVFLGADLFQPTILEQSFPQPLPQLTDFLYRDMALKSAKNGRTADALKDKVDAVDRAGNYKTFFFSIWITSLTRLTSSIVSFRRHQCTVDFPFLNNYGIDFTCNHKDAFPFLKNAS